MEGGNLSLEKAVANLIQSQKVTALQGQQFLHDLKNPNQEQQLIQKSFQLSQVNQFLLHQYILNKYKKQVRTTRKGLTHPQMRAEPNQQEERSTEEESKSNEFGSLSYVSLDMAEQIREEAVQLQALMNFTKWTISDLLLFKDEHKIRSKHQQLLKDYFGIQEIKLIILDEDSKLHSFNSKINYMSEIYETHPKYDNLTSFCQNTTKDQFFFAVQNQQFCNLFGSQKGIGVIRGKGSQKYLLILQMSKYSQKSFNQLKNSSNFCELFFEFAWKITEISMSPTYQLIRESIFNYYAKNWTQLLQLTIRMNYQENFMNIKMDYQKQFSAKFSDVHNYSHFIKAIQNDEETRRSANINEPQKTLRNKNLIAEISKFEELQYYELENLRLYRKMIDNKSAIFLDFNASGKLTFISCNFRHEVISKLKNIWKLKAIQITDIFYKDKQLQDFIKKGSQGKITQGKFYELDELNAKLFLSQEKFVERIQILIEKDGNDFSSESKSSSTNNISQNQFSTKSNNKILAKIQKIDPHIKNQGWISLFLKEQNKNQVTLPANKSLLKKDKRTRSEDNMNYIISSEKSLDSITKNCLKVESMDIDKLDIDLLTLGEENLEPFVIKVMCKLLYFAQLTTEKSLFGNFVKELHENYEIHNNPFHNFIHGVNVMHTSYLLSSIPKNKQVFSKLKLFSIVFSALCHDVGHTGFTNSFQIASRSEKAVTYNDVSPLENYHASRTFQILRKPINNFMCLAKRQQFNQFRKDVISNILFTDIKQHFPMLKNFDAKKSQNNLLTPDDATLLSGIIVHASDFGGSVKTFQISRMWSQRVNRQFTNQYEQQGKLGLPQTPFMKDLTNPLVLSKNESGFLRFIVHPLYKSLNQYYVDDYKVKTLFNQLQQNLKIWVDTQKELEDANKQ